MTGPVLNNNSSCILDTVQSISSSTTGPKTTSREQVENVSAWAFMHGLGIEDIWTHGIGDMGTGDPYRLIKLDIEKVRDMTGPFECTHYSISVGDSDNQTLVARSGAKAVLGNDLMTYVHYICTEMQYNGE